MTIDVLGGMSKPLEKLAETIVAAALHIQIKQTFRSKDVIPRFDPQFGHRLLHYT
jgi:hypothetical protein